MRATDVPGNCWAPCPGVAAVKLIAHGAENAVHHDFGLAQRVAGGNALFNVDVAEHGALYKIFSAHGMNRIKL